jgi:RHS repeat-associated protein
MSAPLAPHRSSHSPARRTIAAAILVVFVTSCLPPEGLSESDELGEITATRQALEGTGSGLDAIPGAFSVGSTGVGSYLLPLWTPQGRMRLEPDLFLRHSTAGTDGPVGVGWSLSAERQIHRCTITSVRYPRPRALAFGPEDAFCIDGQRLVLNDNEHYKHDARYRTEPESFSRFRIEGDADRLGPKRFKVFTREGLIHTFGGDENAYVQGHREVWVASDDGVTLTRKSDQEGRYAWLLRQTEDRLGNRMKFIYSHPSSNRTVGGYQEPLLARIEYAFVGDSPTRIVKLSYAGRPDPASLRSEYIGGLEFRKTQLLRSVEIQVKNPTRNAFETFRHYDLTYKTSAKTKRALLERVKECDGNPTAATAPSCREPTTFDYDPGSDVFTTPSLGSITDVRQAGLNPKQWALQVADIDDDGKDDIVYRALTSGSDKPSWFWRRSTGAGFEAARLMAIGEDDGVGELVLHDLDQDGRPDVLRADAESVNGQTRYTYRYFRNTSSGFSPFPFVDANDELAKAGKTVGIAIGDFGGRGQVTILRPMDENNLWGRRTVSPSGITRMSDPLQCGWDPDWQRSGWNAYLVDIDGDGAQDFLTRDEERADSVLHHMIAIRTPLSAPGGDDDGGEFDYLRSTLRVSTADKPIKYHFFDFNGDGHSDALKLARGEPTELLVNTAAFSGFGGAKPLVLPAGETPIRTGPGSTAEDLEDAGLRFTDFDGDGRTDIMLVDNGAVRDRTAPGSVTRSLVTVLLSRGNGFEKKELTGVPVGLPADGNYAPSGALHRWRQSKLMDANGDGLMDIVQVGSDGALKLYLRESRKVDALVKVRDGMGKRVEISHAPMSDREVYTPATEGCVFPRACVKRGPWLVARYFADNGRVGERNEHRFTYQFGRADQQGRGFLGFDFFTHEDKARSTKTTDVFDSLTRAPIKALEKDNATSPDKVDIYTKIGLIDQRIVRTTNADGTWRQTRIDNDWELKTNYGENTYYTQLKEERVDVSEGSAGGSGAIVRSSKTTYEYEDVRYGFLKSRTTKTRTAGGEISESWSGSYDHEDSTWVLGMLRSETATSTTPSEPTARPRVRLHTYDTATGALKTTQVGEVGTDAYLLTTYVRNQYGQVEAVEAKDRAGVIRKQTVKFDAHSVHPKMITNALGHVLTTENHFALGVPEKEIDANGATLTRKFDRYGRLRREAYPGGGGLTVSYVREAESGWPSGSEHSQLKIIQTRDGGGETRSIVNSAGQETRRETKNLDGTFAYRTSTYNDVGLLSSITRPAAAGQAAGAITQIAYDELERPISTKRPEDGQGASGGTASTSTTYTGLVSTFTDELGRLRRTTVDELGRVVKTEQRNDAGMWVPTEFTTGQFGLLRQVSRKNAAGSQTQTSRFDYDDWGRRTKLTDPDTGTRTYKYNGFGEVREEVDGNGHVTVYERDLLGRVKKRTDRDGTTTFTWDTAANGKGKLAESVSPTGVKRRFAYDGFGRLTGETSVVNGDSYTINYGYDRTLGRLDTISYPTTTGFSRLVVQQKYSANTGEVTKLIKQGTSTVYWEARKTNAAGQITEEDAGNAVRTTYGYSNATGRMTNVRSATSGGTTRRSFTYGYWADGNLLRRSDTTRSEHERFEYDALRQIKLWAKADSSGGLAGGAWKVEYTVDEFGNIHRRKFTPGSAGGSTQDLGYTYEPGTNRVATSPWGSYDYDARGNQTDRPDGEEIDYTAFDLPKTIRGPRAETFQYDADGRRVEKKKASNDFTIYVGSLYEKRMQPGSSKPEHVLYILGPSRPVAQVVRREGVSEQVYYLHSDRLGSVDTVTKSDQGALSGSDRIRLDPFGNRVADFEKPTLPSAVTAVNRAVRLGFTGHEHDDELGLINMKGRMFDPRLGRFLTPDPFVERPMDGTAYNRYSYASNRPLTITDPTGFWEDDPAGYDTRGVGKEAFDALVNEPLEPPAAKEAREEREREIAQARAESFRQEAMAEGGASTAGGVSSGPEKAANGTSAGTEAHVAGENSGAVASARDPRGDHAPAFCGEGGPSCRTAPPTRAEARLDQEVRRALESNVRGSSEPMVQHSLTTEREAISVVYERQNGSLGHTTPREISATGGSWRDVPGTTTVAVVHTHWDPTAEPMFSVGDVKYSRDSGVPYYVALPNGEILAYDPKQHAIRALPTD